MPKTQINEELLILEIQKHPWLFDIDSSNYKDVGMATNSWAEIGRTCEASATECKTRWKSLRDRYVRWKREMKIKSGQGAKSKRPWKYATVMSFLDQYIQEAETFSNLILEDVDQEKDLRESTEQTVDLEDSLIQDGEEDADTSAETVPSSTPSTSTAKKVPQSSRRQPLLAPTKVKRAKNQIDDPVGIAMLSYLQKDADKKELPKSDEQDEDELFLKSQAPALKRLNPQKKAEVKFLIHELLYKAEFCPQMQLSIQAVQPVQVPRPSYAFDRQMQVNAYDGQYPQNDVMEQDWDYGKRYHQL